jgi:ABC-type lipoprotein release transport system permease subunit
MLYGVSPSSPRVFVLTAAMLALVAIVAALFPARRASLANPISALKS